MLNRRVNGESSVAVAVSKDKGSQNALKWAIDHLVFKGQTVTLLHVNQTLSSIPSPTSMCPTVWRFDTSNARIQTCARNTYPSPAVSVANRNEPDKKTMDVFLPFRCFCSLREVLCEDVLLEDQDIAKAIIEYVTYNRVSTLLLGAPSRNGISRLFKTDIPSTVLRGAPHFCNVYVISKRKIAAVRSASRPVPSNLMRQRRQSLPNIQNLETDVLGRANGNRMHDEVTVPDSDISFVSSGRISTDSMFFAFYDNMGSEQTTAMTHRPSKSLSVWDKSYDDSLGLGSKVARFDSTDEVPGMRLDSGKTSFSLPNNQELEEKVRRLEQQMKQTMDMYVTACKEALEAKEKARELQRRNMENEKRLEAVQKAKEEAQKAKEEALVLVEMEKKRAKEAIEAAHTSCRGAMQDAEMKVYAETKALTESEDKKTTLDPLGRSRVVLKYQSLLHITVVMFILYLYFIVLGVNRKL